MNARIALATLFAALLTAHLTHALTVTQTVSPAYLKDNPNTFRVTAERRPDGLVHFTITHALNRPCYLVATTTITDAGKPLLATTSTAFARERSATFYVTVAPDHLADTQFTLFEGSFVDVHGEPVAEPGGVDYEISLKDFPQAAPAPK